MRIIGIAGKFCSGKTTIQHLLHEKDTNKSQEYNFADKVKEIGIDLFGMLPSKKDRRLLQQIGFRMREIDSEVWVNYILNKCINPDKTYIIGDVRYPNEVDAINNNGGLVFYLDRSRDKRLEAYKKLYGRLPTFEEETDVSELLLPDYCDAVIDNNGNLTKTVLEILNFKK